VRGGILIELLRLKEGRRAEYVARNEATREMLRAFREASSGPFVLK
jgi:hypothetical protein